MKLLSREFVCVIEETFFLHPPAWLKDPPRPESTSLFKRYVATAPRMWKQNTSTYQGFYLMAPDGRYLSGTPGQTQKPEAKKLMVAALSKLKSAGAAMRPVPTNSLAVYGGDEPRPGALKLQLAYRDLPRGSVRRPSTAYIQNPYNLGWFDLSAPEARSFITDSDTPKTIPAPLFQKLATKTLKDAVRGQCGEWKPADLKSGSLKSQRISPNTYRLTGDVHLRNGDRSYRAQLHGKVIHDPSAATISEFELVAAGQRTGRNGANGRESDLGPAPMGVAFRQYSIPAE